MSLSPDDKPRRPWVAALLAGVVPGLGHLYLGRPGLAVLFGLATASPLFIAVIIGAYHPTVLFVFMLTSVALHVAIWTASIVSAVVIARRNRTSYLPNRYNHLAVYAAFALVSWLGSNAFAGFLRKSVLEPFGIPSHSMLPTLLPGDQLFVTKVGEQTRRGDVVVFANPLRPDVDFMQRIIGVPGDRIRIENAHIYLNGEEQPKRLVESSYAVQPCFDCETEAGQLYEESLSGRPYRVLEHSSVCARPQNPACTFRAGEEFVVPPSQVFVMGDNRGNSADSRFGFGVEGKTLEFVPFANIKGRAVVIWLSFSLLDGIRWNRLGQIL